MNNLTPLNEKYLSEEDEEGLFKLTPSNNASQHIQKEHLYNVNESDSEKEEHII
jgi:hypothetical protein